MGDVLMWDGIMRPPLTGKCPESGRWIKSPMDGAVVAETRELAPIIICWECGRQLTAKRRLGAYVYPNHQRSR